jgi:hypothetical protein
MRRNWRKFLQAEDTLISQNVGAYSIRPLGVITMKVSSV